MIHYHDVITENLAALQNKKETQNTTSSTFDVTAGMSYGTKIYELIRAQALSLLL